MKNNNWSIILLPPFHKNKSIERIQKEFLLFKNIRIVKKHVKKLKSSLNQNFQILDLTAVNFLLVLIFKETKK